MFHVRVTVKEPSLWIDKRNAGRVSLFLSYYCACAAVMSRHWHYEVDGKMDIILVSAKGKKNLKISTIHET